MSGKYQLLVEGIDDAHLIRNLLGKQGIRNTFIARNGRVVPANCILIQSMGGKENLLNRILDVAVLGDVVTIGIVVDADLDISATWASLKGRLLRGATGEFLETPQIEGTIGVLKRKFQPELKIGVWIMPNNRDVGGLEEFFRTLIETDDVLWSHAQTVVTQLPERRFQPTHQTKTEVATWLAWQDKQRRMGEAVSKGEYLDFGGEECRHFLTWIQQLYIEIL